jgi:2-methylcitrate dehydratase PrpD
MNETRLLARFVVETRFTDLPATLVDNCKIAVLDALSAGFVGTRQPWAQRIVAVVRALGGTPSASVIHQDWRTDVARAALANGVLIGAFECEPLTGSHASGTVLPAALAVSEQERFDGQTFLTSLAVGFEVSARIARTAVGLETERGFHNPGTQGPFGAAAAVGKMYGFDEERLTSALGVAGSSSAGLLEFAWSGGDTKRLHLGRASQLGLESALLARQGLRAHRMGGRTHTLRTRPPKGSPANPFTWDDVCEKFRRYTASVLGAPQAIALIDAVDRLEKVADMAGVARLVARP